MKRLMVAESGLEIGTKVPPTCASIPLRMISEHFGLIRYFVYLSRHATPNTPINDSQTFQHRITLGGLQLPEQNKGRTYETNEKIRFNSKASMALELSSVKKISSESSMSSSVKIQC